MGGGSGHSSYCSALTSHSEDPRLAIQGVLVPGCGRPAPAQGKADVWRITAVQLRPVPDGGADKNSPAPSAKLG